MDKFAFWHGSADDSFALAIEGAQKSIREMMASMKESQESSKFFAACLVEQLLLKAHGMPGGSDKDGICRKVEQWVAGGTYGLQEGLIHPTLVKFSHATHQ